MPERKDASLSCGQIARSENGISMTVEQWAEQLWIIGRIVLQIGILDETKIALRVGQSGTYSRALALINVVLEQADTWFFLRKPLENRIRAVFGTIIDDDQLAFEFLRQRSSQYLPERSLNNSAFVINRN
jgi:hypothetical protein